MEHKYPLPVTVFSDNSIMRIKFLNGLHSIKFYTASSANLLSVFQHLFYEWIAANSPSVCFPDNTQTHLRVVCVLCLRVSAELSLLCCWFAACITLRQIYIIEWRPLSVLLLHSVCMHTMCTQKRNYWYSHVQTGNNNFNGTIVNIIKFRAAYREASEGKPKPLWQQQIARMHI